MQSQLTKIGFVFLLVLYFNCRAEESLQRLDPHGSLDLQYQEIKNLNDHRECSVCHEQGEGALKLRSAVESTCFNCHQRAPHAGIPEHERKQVRCLHCHVAHRSQATDGTPHGKFLASMREHHEQNERNDPSANPTKPHSMIRKNCMNCHSTELSAQNMSKQIHFPHLKHLESFKKIDVQCIDCHSFDKKVESGDILAPPIAAGFLKVSKFVCSQCHGFSQDSTFAQSCQKCHAPQSLKSENHPLTEKVQCLSCHKSIQASHQSLKISNSVNACSACHQERKFQHRALGLLKSQADFKKVNLENSQIACMTCHQIHHNSEKSHLPTAPGEIQQFCASCHGAKAKLLFQNFHKMKKK